MTGVACLGYVDIKEVKAKSDYPSVERLEKGPVAIIECTQNIPCNPCKDACPVGAIKFAGQDITSLPLLDNHACIGCKKCITCCPGQAIFVVNYAYSQEYGTVTFPYEYLPVPKEGMVVTGVNRQGQEVCTVRIVKVEQRKAFNKTPLVTVAVPKEFMEEVRFILV
jgi:Fe-S-cluster-containing hydrogenase component 2